MLDNQEPNPTTNESQTPDSRPEGRFAAARRALNQTLAGVKEGITSLDIREKKVPLEEITERKVAEKIDRQSFDVTTILTNMGYFSTSHDGYPQEHPDAYRLSRIALLGLKRQGILDIRFDEEGTNIHGEDMFYDVIDKQKLQDYLQQSQNEKQA